MTRANQITFYENVTITGSFSFQRDVCVFFRMKIVAMSFETLPGFCSEKLLSYFQLEFFYIQSSGSINVKLKYFKYSIAMKEKCNLFISKCARY